MTIDMESNPDLGVVEILRKKHTKNRETKEARVNVPVHTMKRVASFILKPGCQMEVSENNKDTKEIKKLVILSMSLFFG